MNTSIQHFPKLRIGVLTLALALVTSFGFNTVATAQPVAPTTHSTVSSR